ncbi:hypothetical protein [Photorhabdus antumapuensis]|nr:hypothetical protein [Photorhabdus antumapuensis]
MMEKCGVITRFYGYLAHLVECAAACTAVGFYLRLKKHVSKLLAQ